MVATEDRIAQWKHAYCLLGVPESASPDAIKRAYRKLVKRWHPDRYAAGTEEQAQATQMTEAINASYSVIRDAPLLQRIEPQHVYAPGRPFPQANQRDMQKTRKFDWFGFWVRFVCGAVFGAFIGLGFSIRTLQAYQSGPSVRAVISTIVAGMLACGLLSGFGGDSFWHSFRR